MASYLGASGCITIQGPSNNFFIVAISRSKAMPGTQNCVLIQDGSTAKVTSSTSSDWNLPWDGTSCCSSTNNPI